MSVKTTQRVTREYAIEMLKAELENLSNDTLGNLMDMLADSGQSKRVSSFDNFVVSEFIDNKGNQT